MVQILGAGQVPGYRSLPVETFGVPKCQLKDKLAGIPASLQYSLSQEECQSYELD